MQRKFVDGLRGTAEEKFFCEGCSVPGEIFHADVCGPFIHPSVGGNRYFICFKDESSGYRKVYFMKTKDEVLRCLKIALTEIKQETGRDVQRIRTDGGHEFANREFDNLLTEKKIVHEKSPHYTPKCNGRAERENRTLVEKARSMLHARNLPRCLWADAVHTAAFLLNRIPNRKETTKTPYEEWFGRRPTVEHLQIFGCDAYVHIPDQHRKKFNRRARKVFGDTNKHRVDEVTDVKFNDSLQKRLVLIDGEEDSWMQTADKDEDDFLEEDITDDKTEERGPGRPRKQKQDKKEEALEGANAEKWKEAMLEEISALHMNNTWILTDLPADRKTVQIQTLLAIAADEDLEILQFDVKKAFLHGKIDGLIFMEQPPCFNDGSGRLCKLQRALYGLKQAPRAWNKRLNYFLLTLNLQRAAADPCLCVSAPGAECRIILGLYVDDGLLCCLSLTVLKELVKKLDAEFEIIVGDPSNFVGLEIYRDRSKRTIAIGQKNYIRRVLLKFNMECLSKVALFAENPGLSHWKAVKRIFRYIKGTEDLKLVYCSNLKRDKIGIPLMENEHQLIAFGDNDWAGDADNRRSTVGYIMTRARIFRH
ncbi:Retrovirus-related Pol polyprotein from transposon TNT 1-94 [Trichinella sp. T8]|nr:Retrovirus-related Pol polyprotein from transposon TNT 1-94 [Trichinella sp. T8]